jgi:hypothetical protein
VRPQPVSSQSQDCFDKSRTSGAKALVISGLYGTAKAVPFVSFLCYPLAIETMTDEKTKIKVIEDADATGEVAKVYDEWRAHSGRQKMPGILKCFSHRPDFLREVMSFSNTVHFSEGHLTRRTKEAIASWVSWLNRCPY